MVWQYSGTISGGAGGSTDDWKTASFDDLAGDVVAAFDYLRTRNDIDHSQIGLLGWSQAGWVMPLAGIRAKEIAFLISVSGADVPPGETTIDQTRGGIRMQRLAQRSQRSDCRRRRLRSLEANTWSGAMSILLLLDEFSK